MRYYLEQVDEENHVSEFLEILLGDNLVSIKNQASRKAMSENIVLNLYLDKERKCLVTTKRKGRWR